MAPKAPPPRRGSGAEDATEADGLGFDTLLRVAATTRPLAPIPPPLQPGRTLLDGRFTVQRMLGEGGMGLVFEAQDHELGTVVALKTLPTTEPLATSRLKSEFRALANLVHENLVGWHELFVDDGLWFFTMERVHGVQLSEAHSGAADPLRLQSLFSQLARGVQVVHDAALLHRDLKPSNVIVTREGRVVILDFGLATALSSSTGPSRDPVVGTLAYMSPEHAKGLAMGRAADWYSVGVMLYEALAGRRPFEAPPRASDAPPPKPPLAVEDTSGLASHLAELAVDLLQTKPERRPSGDEILQRLAGPSPSATEQADAERGKRRGEDGDLFVGRRDELDRLEATWSSSAAGHSTAVWVAGESGIGKTALVQRFAEWARARNALVLHARCYEHESIPFKTCDGLLDTLVAHAHSLPPTSARALWPRDAPCLARLFPALGPLLGVSAERYEIPCEAVELQRRAFDALREILHRVSGQRPLLLVVDDLQWCDVDGARLLAHAVANADRLLLVGIHRDNSDDIPGLTVLKESLAQGSRFQQLELGLGPLAPRDAAQVAGTLSEKREDADRLAKEARGNPFLIRAATYTRGSTGGLGDAVLERVASLASTEVQTLHAVCVAGYPLERSVLREALGSADLARALRSLHGTRFTRTTSGEPARVVAYHDRTREIVLSGLAPSQQREWHLRLAKAIERHENPNVDALTRHHLNAGNARRAIQFARQAAQRALEATAFERSIELFDLCLKHASDADADVESIRLERANALAQAGRCALAAHAFADCASRAKGRSAIALRRRGVEQHYLAGNVDAARNALREAFAELDLDYDAILAATDWLPRLAQLDADFVSREEAEIERELLDRADLLWAAALGSVYIAHSSALMVRCAEEALATREPYRVGRSLALLLVVEASLDPVRSRSKLARVQALLGELDDPRARAWSLLAEAQWATLVGDGARAIDASERAEASIRQGCTGMGRELSMARMLAAGYAISVGRLDRRVPRVRAWLQEAAQHGDTYLIGTLPQYLMPMEMLVTPPGPQSEALATKYRRKIDQTRDQWPRSNAAPRILAEFFAIALDAYYERLEGISERCDSAIDALHASPVNTARHELIFRHVCSMARLRVAWALPSDGREDLLRKVDEDVDVFQNLKSLTGRNPEFCDVPWIVVELSAGLAAARGDRERALEAATKLLPLLEDLRLPIRHALGVYRRGRFLGGAEGAACVAEAEELMRQHGIRNIAATERLYAPTFEV